jgi:hypothetical protein
MHIGHREPHHRLNHSTGWGRLTSEARDGRHGPLEDSGLV